MLHHPTAIWVNSLQGSGPAYSQIMKRFAFFVLACCLLVTCHSKPNLQNNQTQDSVTTSTEKSPALPRFQLPADYDRFKVPPKLSGGGDFTVKITFNVGSILAINEELEEVLLDAQIGIEWNETRIYMEALRTNTTIEITYSEDFYVDPEFLQQLWKPDIYIPNLLDEKQPSILRKPGYLYAPPSGLLVYWSSLQLKLKCPFDFAYFPADTQNCTVKMKSYSYSRSRLSLWWRNSGGLYMWGTKNDNYDIAIGDQLRYSVWNRDYLQFSILLRRKMSYQLLQTYVPSMLFVGITWLCFLIPKRMVEARLAITMTTLLTLTAMFASVRESTPAVSYVKAIDVWMCAAIAFVFLVLLEFTVLLWVESERKDKEANDLPLHSNHNRRQRKCLLSLASKAISFAEGNAFVLNLVIVVAFNVSYWSWLMIGSGYFKWSVDPSRNKVSLWHEFVAVEFHNLTQS